MWCIYINTNDICMGVYVLSVSTYYKCYFSQLPEAWPHDPIWRVLFKINISSINNGGASIDKLS